MRCLQILAAVTLAVSATAQTQWYAEPKPRAHGFGAATFDTWRDQIVLFGGETLAGVTDRTFVRRAGVGWREASAAARPAPRRDHALVFDPVRGEAVLFGGRDAGSHFADTWLFDGATWRPALSAHSPTPRRAPMAWDPVGARVLLFGGVDARGTALADTWAWDGADWTRLQPGQGPPAARGATDYAMATDPVRQRVVLVGGAAPSSLSAETWEWDGATWTPTLATGPMARSGHRLAFVQGRTILYGGTSYNALPNVAWQFDGTSWSSVAPTAGPLCWGHELVSVPSQSVALRIGGLVQGRPVFEEWEFDGGAWARPADSPGWRAEAAFAHDARVGRTLLFGGGAAGASLDDTWELRNGLWSRLDPATKPPAFLSGAMAYDPLRDEFVLFGGALGNRTYAETWVFAHGDWSRRAPAHSPSARLDHAMVFDAARGATVLFGGVAIVGSTAFLDDTWEWDGVDWRRVQGSPAPSPRGDHRMAYDPVRGASVLFGGFGPTTGLRDDTWILGVAGWSPLVTATVPPARSLHGMVFDASRERLVVFGGRGQGFLDDTWELTDDWRQRTPSVHPDGLASMLMIFDGSTGETVMTLGQESSLEWVADVWRYGVRPPATTTAFGTSCRGALPTDPVLSVGPPWLGGRFACAIDGMPSGAPAALWLGVRSLAIPLGPAGMPGCFAWVDPVGSLPMVTAGAQATWSVPLSADAALVGVRLFVQGVVFAPSANALGAATTNGVECVAALR